MVGDGTSKTKTNSTLKSESIPAPRAPHRRAGEHGAPRHALGAGPPRRMRLPASAAGGSSRALVDEAAGRPQHAVALSLHARRQR